MLRAIIFDFDGVIADTEPLHFAAFERVLRNTPLAIERGEYFARYVGLSDRVFLQTLAADRNISASDRLSRYFDEKYRAYIDLVGQGTMLIDGLRIFLDGLLTDVPIGICSGARRSEIDLILAQHALTERFAIIVSSEDVQSSKPEPHGYLLALEKLRKASNHTAGELPADECLAIEDSPLGILAARAAGMRTLAMLPRHIGSDVSAADMRRETYSGLTWTELCRRFN